MERWNGFVECPEYVEQATAGFTGSLGGGVVWCDGVVVVWCLGLVGRKSTNIQSLNKGKKVHCILFSGLLSVVITIIYHL